MNVMSFSDMPVDDAEFEAVQNRDTHVRKTKIKRFIPLATYINTQIQIQTNSRVNR